MFLPCNFRSLKKLDLLVLLFPCLDEGPCWPFEHPLARFQIMKMMTAATMIAHIIPLLFLTFFSLSLSKIACAVLYVCHSSSDKIKYNRWFGKVKNYSLSCSSEGRISVNLAKRNLYSFRSPLFSKSGI